MSVNLQYSYAKINLSTGLCTSCFTCSYEIPLEDYIPVPFASDNYIGKYYDQSTGIWFEDADFTIEADGLN